MTIQAFDRQNLKQLRADMDAAEALIIPYNKQKEKSNDI